MIFQKLRVYQAAEQLDALVRPLLTNLPAEFTHDVDEILRALGSLLYNIPEGNGSATPRRRAYHLSVARGSNDEAHSGLRRLFRAGVISQAEFHKASALCTVIAKMLTSMIDRLNHSGFAERQ